MLFKKASTKAKKARAHLGSSLCQFTRRKCDGSVPATDPVGLKTFCNLSDFGINQREVFVYAKTAVIRTLLYRDPNGIAHFETLSVFSLLQFFKYKLV